MDRYVDFYIALKKIVWRGRVV